jgi:phospholipase C
VVMLENRSFDHLLGYLNHPTTGGRTRRLARATRTKL